MDTYRLNKGNVPRLLQRLQEDSEIWAPVLRNGDVLLEAVSDLSQIAHEGDYVNTIIGAKQVLFPREEHMLRFTLDGRVEVEPVYEKRKRVVFGIRSCDVSGINFAERFFTKGGLSDPYFAWRREHTTLISIACLEPGEFCFCVCCEGGPGLESGFDVQLTDIGEAYLAEVDSSRGRAVVEQNRLLFEEASPQDVRREKELLTEAQQKFARSTFVAYMMRRISRAEVPEGFWQWLSDRCLGCAGCRYVCPTCTCFDVRDVAVDGAGERSRCWDSCSLAGFTRMVSGENPREERADRTRRWFYHKLSYQYSIIDGRHGCVGCGRCVASCLGRADTWSGVNRIRAHPLELHR